MTLSLGFMMKRGVKTPWKRVTVFMLIIGAGWEEVARGPTFGASMALPTSSPAGPGAAARGGWETVALGEMQGNLSRRHDC